jgi:hypothetical protein
MRKAVSLHFEKKRYRPDLLQNDNVTFVPPSNHNSHVMRQIDILITWILSSIERNALTVTTKSSFESKKLECE